MKKLWSNIYIRHLVYWTSAYLVIFLSVILYERIILGLEIATLLILPAPLSVYLHFLVLDRYFDKRKYTLYIISMVAVIFISGLWGEYIFNLFFGGPGSHTSGYLMAFLYIVITTALKYFSEGIKNKYALQEIKFKQLQTEMSLLKSQINPHFFFNTLNNLYALSLAKSEEVPSVILKLSELMRYVLETSKKKFVPLESEILFLKNYIELEKLRLENNWQIKFDVIGEIEKFEIAPMLLVPFIENCFKHGVGALHKGGYIKVNVKFDRGVFTFDVINSMPAGNIVKNEDSPRMGLANTRRRLELLYPGKYELNIEDKEDKFEVKLSINK